MRVHTGVIVPQGRDDDELVEAVAVELDGCHQRRASAQGRVRFEQGFAPWRRRFDVAVAGAETNLLERPANRSVLDYADVITPVFKDYSNGTYKILSFFAKKARGSMATFIVKNRITKPEDIKQFDVDGYVFNDSFSSEDKWVFTRKAN